MSYQGIVTIVAVAMFLVACASNSQSPAQESAEAATAASASQEALPPTVAKSRDGSFEGEISGTAVPGSKFAQLQIGMQMDEVQGLFGRAPDRFHTYESGKRWIPFYFGNDARRMQVLYKGEGCLIFTAGGVMGGSGGDLLGIHHDPSGACYQP